ncbi:hypothetical protein PSEUBRA_001622 [Kalmanozyma brasiliensis GHG001]|uniref:uncharacterized protein n=1 Tax=Kalmanozyma brasiliensis (strain GHG001) TaxID=1365824 RepID=UPI002867E136|nr:uncharacterized protein PSEUBRA_001622 [Kalmanozyma brasiliensis GHG001]KAF6766979.1 hypothetical protein PSEUBRA_001622 [Kalmanozyma brasiliensis GHG001]
MDQTMAPSAHGLAAIPTPEIVFEVLPPADGKALLILLFLFNIAIGALILQFITHVQYDIELLCKPGWMQFGKLCSRATYFGCRIFSIIAVVLYIVLFSLKNLDCSSITNATNAFFLLALNASVLIFLQRTMALYAWNRFVVVPLTLWFLAVLSLSLFIIPINSVGFKIPGTSFCGYEAKPNKPYARAVVIAYRSVSLGLDLSLLLLSLHRLLEGGLLSLFRTTQRPRTGLRGQGIASVLIRQGFHYFILQVLNEILILSAWLSSSAAYSGIGAPFALAVTPIAAAHAFRDAGRKASAAASGKQTNHANEIMDPMPMPSGDRIGARTTAHASAIITPHPGRTNRIMWGSKLDPFSRSQHDPFNLEHHNMVVTQVTRVDHDDAGWSPSAARTSSEIDSDERGQNKPQPQ